LSVVADAYDGALGSLDDLHEQGDTLDDGYGWQYTGRCVETKESAAQRETKHIRQKGKARKNANNDAISQHNSHSLLPPSPQPL
jgi:hypothetical protein